MLVSCVLFNVSVVVSMALFFHGRGLGALAMSTRVGELCAC